MNAIIFGLSGDSAIRMIFRCMHLPRNYMLKVYVLSVEWFRDHSVANNLNKCVFLSHNFTYLGYLVAEHSFRSDPTHILALSLHHRPNPRANFILHFVSLVLLTISFVFFHYGAAYVQSFSTKFIRLVFCTRKCTPVIITISVDQGRFPPNVKSTIITDTSIGIGAVLEQKGHPLLRIFRRLSPVGLENFQTQREGLAVFWIVALLHEYLFVYHFTSVPQDVALKFDNNPHTSPAKFSAGMAQRWKISLSMYSYDIYYRKAESIPYADYLSKIGCL